MFSKRKREEKEKGKGKGEGKEARKLSEAHRVRLMWPRVERPTGHEHTGLVVGPGHPNAHPASRCGDTVLKRFRSWPVS